MVCYSHKKMSLLVAILVFALFCTGCVRNSNKGLRLYFFGDGSIDKTFAIKLEKCKRYTTPIKYISTWDYLGLIPKSKHKVKIVGMDRDNRCIIRSYEAYYISPIWTKTYEYRLPKYVLPYLSNIYETAFNEKYGNEVKATEQLHYFCNKYRDFCKNADSIDEKIVPPSNRYSLSSYISSLSYNSAIYDIYLYYRYDFYNKEILRSRQYFKSR